MTTPRDPVARPVRLLIVDDDPLVRAGLTFMLGGVDDITVVGRVRTAPRSRISSTGTAPMWC